MALTRWGFIYKLGSQATGEREDVLGSDDCMLISVGIAALDDGPAVARRLVEDGVQLIELCGAFGPAGTAAIAQAVGGNVPVGGVYYGIEAIAGLAAL
jgi:predicted polyphosphate/ATP-dependent NAD kinase